MKRAISVFYLGFVCLAPIGGMSAWAGPQKARQVAPREAPLPVPRPLDAPADVASLAPLAPPEPDFDASPAPAPKASAEPASPGAGSRRSRHERIVSPALRALVAQHAQANEVPFGLAHAIILIESGYNPGLSHAGAFGLMRLLGRGVGPAGPGHELALRHALSRFGLARFGRRPVRRRHALPVGRSGRTDDRDEPGLLRPRQGSHARRLTWAKTDRMAETRGLSVPPPFIAARLPLYSSCRLVRLWR